jgi:C4-dicarboxylate transporter
MIIGNLNGLVNVVLLIVASTFFARAYACCVSPESVVRELDALGLPLAIVGSVVTALFAAFSGSGDAAIATIAGYFLGNVPPGSHVGPQQLGSMFWFSGEMGRCISPTAAATNTLRPLGALSPQSIAANAFVSVVSGWVVAECLLWLIKAS